MIKLKKEQYITKGNLIRSDEKILNDFIDNYMSTETYICDAIAETVDSETPVYYSELYSKCADLEEYVGYSSVTDYIEANSQDISLSGILSVAAGEYINQLINENFENIIYNYVITYTKDNMHLGALDVEENKEAFIELLDELKEDVDSDYTFSEIDIEIDNLFKTFKDKE